MARVGRSVTAADVGCHGRPRVPALLGCGVLFELWGFWYVSLV